MILAYLLKHGERAYVEAVERVVRTDTLYSHCVTIPSYRENLGATLSSLAQSARHTAARPLVIVVLNQPNWNRRLDRAINQWQWQQLTGASSQAQVYRADVCRAALLEYEGLTVAAIDCFSLPTYIPAKVGVGAARKIACDAACALIASGRITTNWIHCTDGDALLPRDYLQTVTSKVGDVGLCCDFVHRHLAIHDDTVVHAMDLYDKYLRYYATGLKCAGSPYGFTSIGSTLIIDSHAYAQVRGFPKRQAGEDFYLLNKLAKVGGIARKGGEAIVLPGRRSRRVPFGTGRSIQAIADNIRGGKSFDVEHPDCFDRLAEFIAAMSAWLSGPTTTAIPEPCREILHHLKFGRGQLVSITCQPSIALKIRAFHVWFDGLKTLRFIHYYRDRYGLKIPIAHLEAIS